MCLLMVLNGFNTSTLRQGVPQSSVLGSLLFLIYITDLYNAIKFCLVYQFADNTKLLNINERPKILNKVKKYGMKNLKNWLDTNKITLNITKTELIMFKPRYKKLEFGLKIKLNGKKIEVKGICIN